jgi:RNA polymerase sigma-32 factor
MNPPHLSRDEERGLIAAWQERQCYRSRDRLVEAHIAFAYKAARKYCRYSGSLEDLQQEAVLGLLRACDKFDLAQPVRFSTYAIGWVRSFMQQYTLRHAQIISMATNHDNKAAFYRGERLDVISMDRQVLPGLMVGDTIEGDNPDPSEAIDAGIHHDMLMDAVACADISPRDRMIFERRALAEDDTLAVIADELGISRERVRQVEKAAFDKVAKIVRQRLGVMA